jgi:hypothetical protein
MSPLHSERSGGVKSEPEQNHSQQLHTFSPILYSIGKLCRYVWYWEIEESPKLMENKLLSRSRLLYFYDKVSSHSHPTSCWSTIYTKTLNFQAIDSSLSTCLNVYHPFPLQIISDMSRTLCQSLLTWWSAKYFVVGWARGRIRFNLIKT